MTSISIEMFFFLCVYFNVVHVVNRFYKEITFEHRWLIIACINPCTTARRYTIRQKNNYNRIKKKTKSEFIKGERSCSILKTIKIIFLIRMLKLFVTTKTTTNEFYKFSLQIFLGETFTTILNLKSVTKKINLRKYYCFELTPPHALRPNVWMKYESF